MYCGRKQSSMRRNAAALLLFATTTVHAAPRSLTRLAAKLTAPRKRSINLDSKEEATLTPPPKNLRRDNAAAVATVEALIDETDPTWTVISEKDARTKVWKRTDGSKQACVLAKGIIDAPCDTVYTLFADAKRAKDFNEFCDECEDVQRLDDQTKVSWSATKAFGPFKARDFVTLCHFTKMKSGARCIVNRATSHPLKPVTDAYARGEIILAANVVEDAGGGRTRLTLLTQIDPAIDSAVGTKMNNALVVRSPGAFFQAVERAARGPRGATKAAAGVASVAAAAGVAYARRPLSPADRRARAAAARRRNAEVARRARDKRRRRKEMSVYIVCE